MRFWVIGSLVYAATAAAGLGIAGAIPLLSQPSGLLLVPIYAVALAVLVGAAFVLTLMIARLVFPRYWWLGQVLGQDVFEVQGVFFVGLRLSRLPSKVRRLLFGAGERLRRWDAAFGLIWLLLIVLHGLGAATSRRQVEVQMPRPMLLPETMHAALLSDLPVMRALHRQWSADPELMRLLQDQEERIQSIRGKTETDWLKLAQLQLLRAFKVRAVPADAYTFSPMDRAYFERGVAAEAADYLNQVLAVPKAKRAPIARGALTLLGFFYLCEYNYDKAERSLAEALGMIDDPDDSAIPAHWTRLLAAQVALQQGEAERAIGLLTQVQTEPGLPAPLEALTVEHLAEAERLDRAWQKVAPLLDKAGALYAAQGDEAGQARVDLRRSVWLMDRGNLRSSAEELSAASMEAETARDIFAVNMVVRVQQLLPTLL